MNWIKAAHQLPHGKDFERILFVREGSSTIESGFLMNERFIHYLDDNGDKNVIYTVDTSHWLFMKYLLKPGEALASTIGLSFPEQKKELEISFALKDLKSE